MASNDEIVFLSATVSNKPKSNLVDFVAKNRTTDLGLDIKKEKVYEVINFFSNFLFLIFINSILY